jgi:hypothetical protein
VTPKPVRSVRRTAHWAAHQLEAAEHGAGNQIVRSLRGPARSPVVAANGASSMQVRSWAKRNGYEVADKGRLPAAVIDAYNRAR